jgi:hypothetical protein
MTIYELAGQRPEPSFGTLHGRTEESSQGQRGPVIGITVRLRPPDARDLGAEILADGQLNYPQFWPPRYEGRAT